MSILAHTCDILKEKLGEIPFQLWLYNDTNKKSTFICGDERLKKMPSFYTDIDSVNVPAQKWIQKHNQTILYFIYSAEYQVAICISEKDVPLREKDRNTLFYLFQNQALEDRVKQRNTELQTMIDSMNSVTASLQLENVLEKIIKNALNLISPSDAGYLLLYDNVKERLVMKVHVGFSEEMLDFQPKIGEGITGKVFEDGVGRLYNSSEEIDKIMKFFHMSEANLRAIYNQQFIKMEGIICVPITIDGSRIGVIAVHHRTLTPKLTNHDLSILDVFAGQAGIAIQNAELHTEAIQRLDQMTSLSNELKEKNMILNKRYNVHERLVAISLKHKGIQTFINTLSDMLGRPILFFNHLELNFYHHNWHQSKPVFSIFEIKTIFANHMRTVHIEVSDKDGFQKKLYLYPVFNKGLFLGCLILDKHEPITHSDQITLQQGRTAIALELIRKQSDFHNYQQRMYTAFQSLMTSDNQTEVIEAGETLGLVNNSNWITAILEIPEPFFKIQNVNFQIYQLTSQMERSLTEVEKYYYVSYNKIIIFISIRHEREAKAVFHKLQSLKQIRAQDDIPIFRGGLSNVYDGLDHLRTCLKEAENALAYSHKHNLTDLIKYEDIGVSRLFLNQSDSDINKFIHEVFAPFEKDNKRHQDLDQTLRMYIETNRSATQTAKKLHIHKNTLYQRLESIEDLLNINLNNNEDFLEINLAYHLKHQMK